MLSGIVRLLKERGGALSVQEISILLEIESSALYPMLDLLERKGKVLRIELPCGTSCAGGCACSDSMIFYKAA